MTLGKRLAKIESMVTAGYDHIWDCCCDHGLLGAQLLTRQAAPCIHFVDRVPALMGDLEQKLLRFCPLQPTQLPTPPSVQAPIKGSSEWHLHCLDVATLPLQQHAGRHLVIIAGVGGDLMIQLVSAIHSAHPTADIDFLLCPVHHQFALRQQLIRLGFGLRNEALVEENRRCYEILLLCTPAARCQAADSISPVGNQLWRAASATETKIASDYLDKTLRHYKRIQQGNKADVQHIIRAYQAVTVA
ncbi:tRNA (adenine(22)-N(1))-methyltransferase TrmK [Marinobacterium rhizophilum]|uniref:tRNA (Adenine(22)-N(1))-methyltransferase TrmK n=1 Tax=Marinobacterium rhizophilum TaxID=420402 RepID=A0ABY5HPJ9_9GAMM|nr:tRNA (adenine(22)-N(1))-methyltransferase TrmK [Marinobacterium rhizophilum]